MVRSELVATLDALHRAADAGDAAAADRGLRLAGALWLYWYFRGALSEGRLWLGAFLTQSEANAAVEGTAAGQPGQDARLWALVAAGHLALFQGDHTAALVHLEAAVATAQTRSHRAALAYALLFLEGAVLGAQARGAVASGAREARLDHGRRAIALFRRCGDPWGLALALCMHGAAAARIAPGEAQPLLAESLAIFDALGDRWGKAQARRAMGATCAAQGDLRRAREHLETCAAVFQEVGDSWSLAYALRDLGQLLAAGDAAAGQRLLRESARLFDALGNPLEAGRSLAPRPVGAGARPTSPASPPGTAGTNRAGLTTRQQQVAALVAQGQSNREIATTLAVSVRTVDTHVVHILDKLGVSSRAQIAAWAATAGLPGHP
jgi:non-specific serine/threonine protein kinase